jgi:hypothetical protein
VEFHAINSNRLSGSGALTWSNTKGFHAAVADRHGNKIVVRDLHALWWRRVGHPQVLPPDAFDAAQIDLIDNDCRVALGGSLLNEFRGTWVSHPIKTQLAENKLLQLRTAEEAGFRVPRTLVSQDPESIRRFCRRLHGNVIVKPVRGTTRAPLFTQMLRADHLQQDENLRIAPAMYQELISGTRHLRVNAFGDEVYGFAIDSPDLDWRGNLDVPVTEVAIEPTVADRIRTVLRRLGLRMGIVDLKLTPDGQPVWLEINPQGQFLFNEGLCGSPLTSHFARFLYAEATAAARSGTFAEATFSRRSSS